jgi:Xaa-Pro aminopeptidase
VLVVAGAPGAGAADDDAVRAALRRAREEGMSTRDAVAVVTASTGRHKREVYDLAVSLRGQGS